LRPAGLLLPGWLMMLLSIEGRQRRGESMRETCDGARADDALKRLAPSSFS
tara:strand:+ start:853 stop:1005 length:153 start_codon:yes stop_codon:yes gene_type:complete